MPTLEEELSPHFDRDFFVEKISWALTLHDLMPDGPPSGAAITVSTAILHAVGSTPGAVRATGNGWSIELPCGFLMRARRGSDADNRVNKSGVGPETKRSIDDNHQMLLFEVEARPTAAGEAPTKRTVHIMYSRTNGVVSADIIEALAYDKYGKISQRREPSWHLGTWKFAPVSLGAPVYENGVFPDVDSEAGYEDLEPEAVPVGIEDLEPAEDYASGPALKPVVASRELEWTPARARLLLDRMQPGDHEADPDLSDFLVALAASDAEDSEQG